MLKLNLSNILSLMSLIHTIMSDNKSISISLTTVQDNYLFGHEVTIGNQNFILKIDLWSDITWVMDKNCQKCVNNKYDPLYSIENSTTIILTNWTYDVNYTDRTSLFGLIVTDNFKFEELNTPINFLLVNDTTDYYEWGVGTIGFGLPTNPNKTNHSLMYILKNNNIISNLILGISLKTLSNEKSQLKLGAYDTDIVKNVSEIKYCNAINNSQNIYTYWGCQMHMAKIGQDNYNLSKPVVFDTGVDDIKIPLKDFLLIKDSIFKNKKPNCQYGRDNYFHCICDSVDRESLNNIDLYLDNNFSISITPKDYSQIQSQTPDNINCILYISVSYNTDLWQIGNNLLNDYYTILNYDDKTIGFYDIRAQSDDASITILYITIIFVFATLIFFIVLLAIYKKCTNRELNQNGQRNAYQHI